jgi:hypothetical protein
MVQIRMPTIWDPGKQKYLRNFRSSPGQRLPGLANSRRTELRIAATPQYRHPANPKALPPA